MSYLKVTIRGKIIYEVFLKNNAITFSTRVVIVINNKMSVELETNLIVARVRSTLKIKHGFINEILDNKISEKEMFFYIGLILRCDFNEKGYTNKVKTLATVTQIIYLATKIHSLATENTGQKRKFKKEVQMPILIGDLLYGEIYDILCKEDSLEFTDDILEYVSTLSLGWINFFEGKISREDLCAIWYGNLGAMALNLMVQVNNEGNVFTNTEEIGLLFGNLFGAKNLNLSDEIINKCFLDLKNALAEVKDPAKRDLLKEYLDEIYE